MLQSTFNNTVNDTAIHATTLHFIVIGNPIAHSKSPAIHQAFAKQANLAIEYNRQYCPDDSASFSAVINAFKHGGGVGANVTVPFKQIAFEVCHDQAGISPHAQVAGAVNTLILKQGQWYGDNTDGRGLVKHIEQLGWSLSGAKVAIIGAGGAARGVILPLIESGISALSIANRTVSKAESLVTALCDASADIMAINPQVCATHELTGDFDLIINATSIGLSDDTLPLAHNLTCKYAYDMMYGKALPFLTHFSDLGAKTSDGYGMLMAQAALSFECWTGIAVDPFSIEISQ